MRNKIQEEEKTIEKSSVDEETMKNGDDWPDRGDEKSDGWPTNHQEEGDDVTNKGSALKRDVTSVERDIENVVDYDDGHPAEAMLLMGLAMLFIGMFVVLENFNRNRVSLTSCYILKTGFVVIRFKQSRPSIRRRHNNMSVQRPPDGTFEVELDRAHHGEL